MLCLAVTILCLAWKKKEFSYSRQLEGDRDRIACINVHIRNVWSSSPCKAKWMAHKLLIPPVWCVHANKHGMLGWSQVELNWPLYFFVITMAMMTMMTVYNRRKKVPTTGPTTRAGSKTASTYACIIMWFVLAREKKHTKALYPVISWIGKVLNLYWLIDWQNYTF